MGIQTRKGFLTLNNNSPIIRGVYKSERIIEKDRNQQMLELASFTLFERLISSMPSILPSITPMKQQQPLGTDSNAFVSSFSLFLLI